MAKRVLIIDTSILCVWLQVPGMDTCGPDDNHWNYDRVKEKIDREMKSNALFVLPLATIIETGNHISQVSGDNYQLAEKLGELMKYSAEEKKPWAAFAAQADDLWSKGKLIELANNWPKLAAQKISIGDATIKDVADYYHSLGDNYHVEIFTGDEGLKAYSPTPIKEERVPRRRRGK